MGKLEMTESEIKFRSIVKHFPKSIKEHGPIQAYDKYSKSRVGKRLIKNHEMLGIFAAGFLFGREAEKKRILEKIGKVNRKWAS